MAISKPITEQTVEEYKKQYAVNGMLTLQRFLSPFTWLISSTVDGVFYCAKFSGQVFKKQGFGNLIITSSISAHIVNVPVDQPVSIPSLCNASRMQTVSNAIRSTTQRKPQSTTSARALPANGGSSPESTSSHRASSTLRWARLLVSSTKRPE